MKAILRASHKDTCRRVQRRSGDARSSAKRHPSPSVNLTEINVLTFLSPAPYSPPITLLVVVDYRFVFFSFISSLLASVSRHVRQQGYRDRYQPYILPFLLRKWFEDFRKKVFSLNGESFRGFEFRIGSSLLKVFDSFPPFLNPKSLLYIFPFLHRRVGFLLGWFCGRGRGKTGRFLVWKLVWEKVENLYWFPFGWKLFLSKTQSYWELIVTLENTSLNKRTSRIFSQFPLVAIRIWRLAWWSCCSAWSNSRFAAP